MIKNTKIIFLLNFFFVLFSQISSLPCPNLCNGHGRCSSPGRTCECIAGYTGADCSEKLCPFGSAWVDIAISEDKAHQLSECSNMGICDRSSGICSCRDGFEGAACEKQSCLDNCNNVGECVSMKYNALNKDAGYGPIYVYENVWDFNKIYGCKCDEGYFGVSCEKKSCPTGDDPLTGTLNLDSTNVLQENDQQELYCIADSGTFTLSFKGETTLPIPFDAKIDDFQSALESLNNIGKGNLEISMSDSQICTDSGASSSITFLQNFGDLPLLLADKRKLLLNSNIASSAITITKNIVGTKENSFCSNRGVCNTKDGVCECSLGFDTSNGYNAPGTRGDCGYMFDLIQYCPGLISCSGHGKCNGNPTYKCDCNDGWSGSDCSERTCPFGLSWFSLPDDDNNAHISKQTECSTAGDCNRETGECSCLPGFGGKSCERLVCPILEDSKAICSGHGQCFNMKTLATYAEVNGENIPNDYGVTPNDPLTWDSNRIFGCLCDDTYTGFDCSLRTCPYGDDPESLNQFDEVQEITCSADSSISASFVLSFRDQTTSQLFPSSTLSQLKEALESLSTVGKVRLEYASLYPTDTICDTIGHTINVTFLTKHGNLPLIKANLVNFSELSVSKHRSGTKEMLECSGRGLCNRETGFCECFEGYGSSDGTGKIGYLGDCGYREPFTLRGNK